MSPDTKTMSREKKLESALVISAGFVLLFFIFKLQWLLLTAFAVALLSALSAWFLNGLTWGWFRLSALLGWVNTRIVLGIVFYAVLFPITLAARLTGRDSLRLKKSKASLYHGRNHAYKPGDLENAW